MTKVDTIFRFACIVLIILTAMVIVDIIITAKVEGIRPDGSRSGDEQLPKVIEGKYTVVKEASVEAGNDSPG